jgi:hypothetical protein
MTLLFPEIDRENMTPEQLSDFYNGYWNSKKAQHQSNHHFFQSRIKQLGYTSMADFRRHHPELAVTAGTLSNYFRGYNTIPIYAIQPLCYALRMTPNTLLSILGYYDPKHQTVVDL